MNKVDLSDYFAKTIVTRIRNDNDVLLSSHVFNLGMGYDEVAITAWSQLVMLNREGDRIKALPVKMAGEILRVDDTLADKQKKVGGIYFQITPEHIKYSASITACRRVVNKPDLT